VSALLSHRTKNADSHRAYQKLRAMLPTWAPLIQTVLREINQHCGTDAPYALDFLAEMPVAKSRAWLESISGVGP